MKNILRGIGGTLGFGLERRLLVSEKVEQADFEITELTKVGESYFAFFRSPEYAFYKKFSSEEKNNLEIGQKYEITYRRSDLVLMGYTFQRSSEKVEKYRESHGAKVESMVLIK